MMNDSTTKGAIIRNSLRILAIAVILIVVLSPLTSQISEAATSSGTATPIKHVIMITMENHSFDNILGKYPYNPSGNQSIISNITAPNDLASVSSQANLTPVPVGKFSAGNPREGYSAYHLDWNNGKMNGFLNGSGPNSLYYFTAAQMAPEWDLMQQYAMGDMYFSGTLSETIPNRMIELAGYSPVMNDYGPPPYVPLNQTILYQLASSGVSWGYYINNTASGLGVLSLIKNIGSYSGNIQTWGNFYGQLSNGTLPSVSWLEPVQGGAEKYSQHPSFNMLFGELWLLYTVRAVMSSPLWNSTAIIINYDENGGYYDSVSPPSISGHQLGVRVPFLIISPYAKENYVSSTVLSHTSLLAFIEYNWKLKALNGLVQESNIPLDFFNFNTPYSNGNVTRTPFQFPPALAQIIPNTPNFGKDAFSGIANTDSLFPLHFQISTSKLPYSLHGSSNVTLKSLGKSIENSINYSTIPIYESILSVVSVLVAGSAVLIYLGQRLSLKRK